MRHIRFVTLLAALSLLVAGLPAGSVGAQSSAATQGQDCSFPVTVVDGTGTEVTVEQEPERVVVLQASAAQVMWEIGAKELVVGMPVKPYTAYLNGSERRTNVIDEDGSVNVEKVVGLQPDLVLAPNLIPNETVEQLRRAGLTVYKTDFDSSLEDISQKITLFGRFTGHCEQAERVRQQFEERIATIREAVADEPAPRVLYYFYNFTAGSETFIHEIIETAGGDNIAANAGIERYAEINPEIVAARNPQWIFHPSDAPLPTGEPYVSTTAFEKNQTLTVNANLMNQPAPRVVIPMTKLARAWHPEALAQANLTFTANASTNVTFNANGTTTANTTATVAQTADGSGGGAGGDGADGGEPSPAATEGPGFGAFSAVLAVLAAALVARHRD